MVARVTSVAEKYAWDVAEGHIAAGRLARLACQRHLSDLERSNIWFDHERAQAAVDFFPTFLRHSKDRWAGKPFVLAPWQQFTLWAIFGWMKIDADGQKVRRFREVYESVARKNGKSTKWAGLGLYGIVADGVEGARVFSAATSREQARAIFDEAKNMVRSSPELSTIVDIRKSILHVEETDSQFVPLSKETKTQHGTNPSMGLIDELHVHPNRDMYDVLYTGTASRSEPLTACISTRGNNAESFCKEHDDLATAILEGRLADDSFFAYVATLDEDDDPFDESVWVKANPNLGVSVSLEDMRANAVKAKINGAYLNSFKQLKLNLWVVGENQPVKPEDWAACGRTFDWSGLVGATCYGGLDLAYNEDLCAFVLAFGSPDGWIQLVPMFWIPESGIDDKSHRHRMQYRRLADEGWIKIIPGNTIQQDFIEGEIIELSRQYAIASIAYDPWNAAALAARLEQEHGFEMQQFRQGVYSFNEPTRRLLDGIITQDVTHPNSPILTSHMLNMRTKTDPSGNIRPVKPEHGGGLKIDGAVAAIMAAGVAMHEL